MAKKYFFPHNSAERMVCFKNLVAKLPGYQQRYSLRGEDVQELVNSETAMVHWVGYNALLQNYARSMAEHIRALQSGDNAVPLALAAPARFCAARLYAHLWPVQPGSCHWQQHKKQ